MNDIDFNFNASKQLEELFDKIQTNAPTDLYPTLDNTTENDKFVFFWGSYLSNWAKSKFVYEDIEYTSSEQAMMAAKAKMFGDALAFHDIMKTQDPSEQKAIGKRVIGYNEAEWAKHRYNIVVNILKAKFEQNNIFRDKLMATGNKKLVESSPMDKIWGIGMSDSDPDILDESKWKGTNLLGKALMEVRSYLRGEEIFE